MTTQKFFKIGALIRGGYSRHCVHTDEPEIEFRINLAGRNLESPLGKDQAICEGIKVLLEQYRRMARN